ncbi:MAG: enoyl-CoA hydratase/isomerase family protein [Candidatus Binatia bacterium]
MGYRQITYEVRHDVAWITLNRPEHLNAWTPHMAGEQADAIERANADRSVGAIVMTGAGRGFCAGADMQETFKTRIEGTDPGGDTAAGEGGMPAALDWVALVRRAKPLIAAVNGAAVGIGMTMILPFDVIVASDKARFGMLFIKMGLVPELASTHFLVQRVGWGKASEMCLSGRLCGADEAARMGLADRLVPAEQLADEAQRVAAEIATNPDPQLRMIKELLTSNATATDLRAIQHRETEMLRHCWTTPEHKEAVQAFLDKRPPKFR